MFQYFKENEVLSLIKKLQEQFSNPQILFDAVDEFGIKYAQKYVKKTANTSAMMYFFINDPDEFAKKANTRLLSSYEFYTNVIKLKGELKHV